MFDISNTFIVIELSLGIPKVFFYDKKEGLMHVGSPLSRELFSSNDYHWDLAKKLQTLINENINLFINDNHHFLSKTNDNILDYLKQLL